MKPEIPQTDAQLPRIRIGEVAQILGISTSALRQYESLGLVLPYKEDSGQRMYSQHDIDWLRKLQAFFVESHTGPTALARFMRLMPTRELRNRRNLKVCNVAAPGMICWQVHPELRRKCRGCPAYLEKDSILEFEKHFRICLR